MLEALCRDFRLDMSEARRVYEENLSAAIPDKELIDTLIEPLCDMIRLDHAEDERIPQKRVSDEDRLYYDICNAIHTLHNSKLSLETLCAKTHYSKSHMSHLFRRRSGMTINQYANSIHIVEAKALLGSTVMSVQEIALTVGGE